jgi:hypothetical protein
MPAEEPTKLDYAARPEVLGQNVRASISLWMSVGALPLSFFSSIIGSMLVAVVERLAESSLPPVAIKSIQMVLFGACILWPLPYALITDIRSIAEIRREPAHGLWKAIVGIALSSVFLFADVCIVLRKFAL